MRVTVMDGRDLVYKGEAWEAVMPGYDGEFSVWDFHQPLLYRLRRGLIKIRSEKEGIFRVKDGLARFSGNNLLILCEM